MVNSLWQQIETILLIGVGGFIGANARQWVTVWAGERFGSAFPWGTLLINVSGSCLLTVFLVWSGKYLSLEPRPRLFFAVGFFGAYTTFSTFAYNSVTMAYGGDWTGALANIFGTNALCLLGAWLGLLIGSRL